MTNVSCIARATLLEYRYSDYVGRMCVDPKSSEFRHRGWQGASVLSEFLIVDWLHSYLSLTAL